MKVRIIAQGGIAGLQMTKVVDVDDLPPPERQEYEAAFAPTALAERATQSGAMGADRMSYQITITDDTHPSQTFTLQEQQLTPQMLDLFDQM